jgi:hypothetical protein
MPSAINNGEGGSPLMSNITDRRDALVKAYIAGATDVHYAWVNSLGEENAPDHEADFTEAAHDYADSLPEPPLADSSQ